MKKILLFVLLFFPFIVHSQQEEVVLLWGIFTEEEQAIPGVDIEVKTLNNSFTICSDTSNSEGLVYLQCSLEIGSSYNLFVKWELYKQFTPIDLIQTIGIYEYNDIKIGFYSQDLNLSIFSEEYKQIQENLFWLQYGEEQGHNFEGYFFLDILFLCKDDTFTPKRVKYTLSYDWNIIDTGNNTDIRALTIEKGSIRPITMQYEDISVIREINFYPDNQTKIILLENCDVSNSEINRDNFFRIRTIGESFETKTREEILWEENVILEAGEVIEEVVKQTVITTNGELISRDSAIKKEERMNLFIIFFCFLVSSLLYIFYGLYKKRYKIK